MTTHRFKNELIKLRGRYSHILEELNTSISIEIRNFGSRELRYAWDNFEPGYLDDSNQVDKSYIEQLEKFKIYLNELAGQARMYGPDTQYSQIYSIFGNIHKLTEVMETDDKLIVDALSEERREFSEFRHLVEEKHMGSIYTINRDDKDIDSRLILKLPFPNMYLIEYMEVCMLYDIIKKLEKVELYEIDTIIHNNTKKYKLHISSYEYVELIQHNTIQKVLLGISKSLLDIITPNYIRVIDLDTFNNYWPFKKDLIGELKDKLDQYNFTITTAQKMRLLGGNCKYKDLLPLELICIEIIKEAIRLV